MSGIDVIFIVAAIIVIILTSLVFFSDNHEIYSNIETNEKCKILEVMTYSDNGEEYVSYETKDGVFTEQVSDFNKKWKRFN